MFGGNLDLSAFDISDNRDILSCEIRCARKSICNSMKLHLKILNLIPAFSEAFKIMSIMALILLFCH